MPQTTKIFSWTSTADESEIIPLCWADMSADPTVEATRVIAQLRDIEPGNRAVFLFHCMDASYAGMGTNVPAFVAAGPNIAQDQAWCRTFFGAIKAASLDFDFLITDDEDNFSVWAIFGSSTAAQCVAIMQSIYTTAGSVLPASLMQNHAPADYSSQFTTNGRAAFIAWDAYASVVSRDARKRAVLDPLHEILGFGIKSGNFGETKTTIPMNDVNGWPNNGDGLTIAGDINCPMGYLSGGNKFPTMKLAWSWNRFVDILNNVRACLATNSPLPIAVWLSVPTYRGDTTPPAKTTWLWEQLVRHLAAMGITLYLYFNPTGPQADDDFASLLFEEIVPAALPTSAPPQIAFDSQTITTGNFTTMYADFLKLGIL